MNLLIPPTATHSGPAPEDTAIYRAVKDHSYGFIEDGELVCGLRLERVYCGQFDPLKEDYEQVGAEVKVHLPDCGIVEGRLYRPAITGIQRDWETNTIDDWDITLYPYIGELPKEQP